MTATPDSFSMADLEAMLENAPQDITDIQPKAPESEEDRVDRFVSMATEALDNLTEDLSGQDAAQVEKAILHMISTKMVEWHSRVGHRVAEEGDLRSAIGWLRDAGKFQAMLDSLVNIGVGPNDHTCDHE